MDIQRAEARDIEEALRQNVSISCRHAKIRRQLHQPREEVRLRKATAGLGPAQSPGILHLIAGLSRHNSVLNVRLVVQHRTGTAKDLHQ